MGRLLTKNNLKFCKLYEEDVFGLFSIRPKRSQKVLNIIYKELLKKKKKKVKVIYLNFLKNCKSIIIHLLFIKKKLFKPYKVDSFGSYNNLLNKINSVIFLLKKIVAFLSVQSSFFKGSEGVFNYRVDIGDPLRKKKKITKYKIRLLTRHKLTSFCSKMTVYQFDRYLSCFRNLKFFSMNFIFALESRIDFILYRLNLSNSSGFIRQFIRHEGVLVNNKLISVPSFRLKLGDILSFKDKKKVFEFFFFNFYKRIIFMSLPNYYEVNFRTLSFLFFMSPRLETIFYPFSIDKLRLSTFGKHF